MHTDFVYRRKGDKDSIANVVCINYYNVLNTFSISKMYTF